jgi:hypothetical protein
MRHRSKQDYKILDALSDAATAGDFHKVPKKHLTQEYLGAQDSLGMHAVHIAASNENLYTVPKEFFTPEIILTKDNGGQSVLHYAATFGEIHLIPPEVLTEENLLEADEEGHTVYHYLANYGYLNQISKSLITEKAVTTKNEFDRDVLDMAIHAECKDIPDPNLMKDQCHLLTQALSDKTLRSMIKFSKGKIDKEKISLCRKELKKREMVKLIKLAAKESKEQSIDL